MTKESAKKSVRYVLKTMKWIFIVFCVFLASLFFREQRLPKFVTESITDAVTSSNLVVHCESASFGFRNGLRLRQLKLYDPSRKDVKPVASLKSLTLNPITRHVVVMDLRYPRLPDGYYAPSSKKAVNVTRPFPDIELRAMDRFRLTLIRPEILGIAARRIDLQVEVREHEVLADDIRLFWPGLDRGLKLSGFCKVDLEEKRVKGEVLGRATQALIRPLLVTLDIKAALPYIDAFTQVPEPVNAQCGWDVDLTTGNFRLKLGLHPKLGCYRGVPMDHADGELTLNIQPDSRRFVWEIQVGPIAATDVSGRHMSGTVGVFGTNDVCRLHFDVSSQLPLAGALRFSEFLDDGTLDCLKCETDPQITVRGVLAPDVAGQAENAVGGNASFARGRFFGVPVENVSLRYDYIGDTVTFTNVVASGKGGGRVSGWGAIAVPGLDAEKATWRLACTVADGSLEELADVFHFDPGEKYGRVNANLALSGAVGTNRNDRLNGSGNIRISDGRLAQMKLFAGLTTMLAEKVPGVSSVVNQSDATCTFTVRNGVVMSDDIFIEGGLFSIKAYGTYDSVKDNLDFTLRVQFLRNDSLLGKLVHPVTWVFTKLLLEYRLSGSLANPKWEYITIPERIIPR